VAQGICKVALVSVTCLALATGCGIDSRNAPAPESGLDKIRTIVVIYLENRSFDNLYGDFPGANGSANPSEDAYVQVDRDGKTLAKLPPIWQGLTPRGVVPDIDEPATRDLANKPFAIDDPKGFNLGPHIRTRDFVHLFYQNQMQINGGKNDRFVAYGDSGALVMGHYDGGELPLWKFARRYVLADNFYMGVFGGSFLNHFYLSCACIPKYPNADTSPAKGLIASVADDGVSLKLAKDSPASALDGIPKFENDGRLTPDFYAVNTMQPPYQPSGVPPVPDGDKTLADTEKSATLPPQTQTTIGDLLSANGVTWAWYAGAWAATLHNIHNIHVEPNPRFQTHHQPFNYFARFAPGTASRIEHLRDGGLDGAEFIEAIDAGTLPQVTFYKPQGSFNEHAGYADVLSGERHTKEIIEHLERSPQWPHMLAIVTYDENGGFWDHARTPKGDRWGPGTRIPALIISPFAKKGTVDHTLYDTGSILRFLTRRFDLPVLPGLLLRDESIRAAGKPAPGDLTNALDLRALLP